MYNALINTHSGKLKHSTHHSEHGEEDDQRDGEVGGVRVSVDVGVTILIDLQHTQPRDHVHE